MGIGKNEIPEILSMYEKYCKELELLEPDKLPPLTLNEQEYMTALIDPQRIKSAKRTLKTALGQTAFKTEKYNHVILVNIEKMKYLKGLHEYEDWKPIQKRKHKYLIRNKIPHLEETLIHELVHIKYPHLRHGDRFNQIVRNIYLKYNNNK